MWFFMNECDNCAGRGFWNLEAGAMDTSDNDRIWTCILYSRLSVNMFYELGLTC